MTLKKELGQFFTKNNLWLKPQVLTFIEKDLSKIVYDPFAGDFDEKLKYSMQMVPNIEVFLYKVDFTLKEFKGI